MTTATQTAIAAVVLEAADPVAAEAFYEEAFGLGERVRVRPVVADEPSSGFRAFTLSLVVAQPGVVDSYINSAVAAGATVIKDPKKSMWGYGGVVQAPDGSIWKVATSAKKDSGPTAREVEDLVLLLGCDDVKATKKFYEQHGLAVDKSFGSKYVQFAAGAPGAVKLALYGRRALAKDAGVDPAGSGAHRLTIVAGGSGAPFTDPDGFAWE